MARLMGEEGLLRTVAPEEAGGAGMGTMLFPLNMLMNTQATEH